MSNDVAGLAASLRSGGTPFTHSIFWGGTVHRGNTLPLSRALSSKLISTMRKKEPHSSPFLPIISLDVISEKKHSFPHDDRRTTRQWVNHAYGPHHSLLFSIGFQPLKMDCKRSLLNRLRFKPPINQSKMYTRIVDLMDANQITSCSEQPTKLTYTC